MRAHVSVRCLIAVTEAPQFKQDAYTLALFPGMAVDSVVAQVIKEDTQHDSVVYTIQGDVPCAINALGEIRVVGVLNHNETQNYSFPVEASDGSATDTVAITARFVSDAGVRLERRAPHR